MIDDKNASELIYSEEARLALFHSLAQTVNENTTNSSDIQDNDGNERKANT